MKTLKDFVPIETERLIIRPTTIQDISLLLKMDHQEKTQFYLGGVKEKTKEERIEFLKRKEEKWQLYGMGSLTVYLKEGTPIGFIGLKENELSYIFDYDYWKNGYCLEACQRILQIAFIDLGLSRVIAHSKEENIDSVRVLERLGFTSVGKKDEFMEYELENKCMIDIIIPVYNTPKKDLERCLTSINNQTYPNYQVYMIDDGSEKETHDYLDQFVKENPRFLVKHISNGGVSNARNIGINHTHSKYLTFVDADDTITPTFLGEAFHLIEEYDLDCIIGGYNEMKNEEIKRTRLCMSGLHIYDRKNKDLFLEKLLSSKTTEENQEIGDCPTGRIYTRLYKRASLGNLRFNTNVHMSEDTLFMIDYAILSSKIGIIDRVWYNYYINDYSISNGTKRDKLIKNIEGFIEEIKKRKEKETKENLRNAYEARIKKAENYIEELKNEI